MSLITEVRIFSPEFPLMEALSAVPGMELRVEQTIAEHSEQPTLFLWAAGGNFEKFEAAVKADPTIEDLTQIEDMGVRRLYRVKVTAGTQMILYPTEAEIGASRLAVTASARGVDTRMRLPDRTALREFQKICDERGINFSLKGVYQSEDPSPGQYELSPKQRTALEAAVKNGYYAVPRKVTLEELATELDISRQAASERLRRGCHVLIKNTLDVSEHRSHEKEQNEEAEQEADRTD